ncbi:MULTISPECIES: NUDIX domain-containing protein [unclassified Streptomyces]|uniref:NUDIX domain-containing protein n=1 Tax=unclassified Streptomyces TaxID=2593676 RepID=UPI0009399CF3|nr:NUDIX domain-containing protein [Streptomyces sp. TSRI0107]OKJ77287.1 DNA mismatch repair protein MutT [Streptomyces sp. TSRI0107]
MTGRRSAGLLLFRRTERGLEVLLGHMGGPYFARKDAGAWTVPKGEYEADEPAWEAARREFREELGVTPPDGAAVPLGEVRQTGGKTVTVWAVEGDLDPGSVVPGTFTMEWPPRSGRTAEFPELDRVGWFGLDAARAVIVRAQAAFLDRLAEHSP